MTKTPLFHKGHYNIIAAQIKGSFPITVLEGSARQIYLTRCSTLTNLALSLTERFKEDNPLFDPIKFLDACSPDPDTMPLSELWEDE